MLDILFINKNERKRVAGFAWASFEFNMYSGKPIIWHEEPQDRAIACMTRITEHLKEIINVCSIHVVDSIKYVNTYEMFKTLHAGKLEAFVPVISKILEKIDTQKSRTEFWEWMGLDHDSKFLLVSFYLD